MREDAPLLGPESDSDDDTDDSHSEETSKEEKTPHRFQIAIMILSVVVIGFAVHQNRDTVPSHKSQSGGSIGSDTFSNTVDLSPNTHVDSPKSINQPSSGGSAVDPNAKHETVKSEAQTDQKIPNSGKSNHVSTPLGGVPAQKIDRSKDPGTLSSLASCLNGSQNTPQKTCTPGVSNAKYPTDLPLTRRVCCEQSRHCYWGNVCYGISQLTGKFLEVVPPDETPEETNLATNPKLDRKLEKFGEAVLVTKLGLNNGPFKNPKKFPLSWICGTSYFIDRRVHMPNFLEGMIGLFEYYFDGSWEQTQPIDHIVFNHHRPVNIPPFEPNPVRWVGGWSQGLFNLTVQMCPNCVENIFDEVYFPKTNLGKLAGAGKILCFERLVMDAPLRFFGHPDHFEYKPGPNFVPNYWFSQKGYCDAFRTNIYESFGIQMTKIQKSEIKEIHLLRRLTGGRNMQNEDEFISAAANAGLKITVVEPGSDDIQNFEAHVRLFAQFKILITPHGANEASIMFMPKGSLLLEFFHYKVRSRGAQKGCDFFASLAKVCGMEYLKWQNKQKPSNECNGGQSTKTKPVEVEEILGLVQTYLSS